MARANFTVNLDALEKIQANMTNQNLMNQLRNIVGQREIAAIVAQAIADNFEQEGPGWQPLKAQTIRMSVAKKLRKKLDKLTDEEILYHERKARLVGAEETPNRQILRRTSLLFQTVTTPGFVGSKKDPNDKKAHTGQNIYRTEGTNLIWGTNLIYAGVHNYGHRQVPQREYLKIRDEWQKELEEYAAELMARLVDFHLEGES